MYESITNTVLRSFSHNCILFSSNIFPLTLPVKDGTLKCSLGVPWFTYEIYFDTVRSKVCEQSVGHCARLVGTILQMGLVL
jgi:hypothetical protein